MTTPIRLEEGTPKPGDAPRRGDESRELLDRAARGDESALPAVRAWLADPERGARLTEALGSPAEWLRAEMIGKAAGKNLAVQEAMGKKLAGVRAGLEGPEPTPIERLLAERAALCWLVVYCYENWFARNNDMTIRQAEFHQAKIDRAHRRFLSAAKALAAVRKLALPALQINIAKNQVNVSGGGDQPDSPPAG